MKQTEIFMLHHAAFETRDPRVLSGLHADLQAGLTAMLQMLMQEVLKQEADTIIAAEPGAEELLRYREILEQIKLIKTSRAAKPG